MKLAVMGAGACGGYYGACLARRGVDVTFIARAAHVATIERLGVRVQSLNGDFAIAGNVTSDPNNIGTVDVVLLAVKTPDLDDALDLIAPMVGARTLVWCVQNGVDAPAQAAARYGAHRVIAGSLRIEAVLFAPGRIGHLSPFSSASLAPWRRKKDSRDLALLDALRDANIEADLHEDADVMLWTKLLGLSPNASLTSMCRVPLGEVLRCSETRAMFRAACAEVVTVAAALGIDLGGEAAVERTITLHDGFSPHFRTSMQRDIDAGKRIELDSITGAVLRAGRRTDTSIPVHDFAYAALRPYALAAEARWKTGEQRRLMFGEYLVGIGQISDSQLRTVLGLQTLDHVRGGRLRIGDALEELGVLPREAIEQRCADFKSLQAYQT